MEGRIESLILSYSKGQPLAALLLDVSRESTTVLVYRRTIRLHILILPDLGADTMVNARLSD